MQSTGYIKIKVVINHPDNVTAFDALQTVSSEMDYSMDYSEGDTRIVDTEVVAVDSDHEF